MIKHYRGNTVLIELLIVILFFALSAVIALGLFVTAQQRSEHSQNTTQASMFAQDIAEMLAGETDRENMLAQAGFSETSDEYIRQTDADVQLRVTLDEVAYAQGTLYTARVCAYVKEQLLLELPVAYYACGEVGA